MFFNWYPNSRVRQGIFFCLFLLAGCSLRFNESPPQNQVIDIGPDSGCLSGASETLNRYFLGEGSPDSISEFFRCSSRSLQIFVERTQGSEPGKYSAQELRNFLERHFLKGTRISNGFLSDAMALKQSFWGGSDQTITVDEIDRVRKLFEIFRVYSVKLHPYQPLSRNHIAALSADALETAVSTLNEASNAIGDLIPQSSTAYSFEKLEHLMFEIERIYEDGDSKPLRCHLPLIEVLKSTLLSSETHGISGKDWPRLFRVVSGWYSLFLRLSYVSVNNLDWTQGRAHEIFTKALQQGKSLMQDALYHQPNQTITFQEIDELIDLLPSENLILEKKTMKDLLKRSIQKILTPRTYGTDLSQIPGFTLDGLNHLWSHIDDWIVGQQLLEAVFDRLSISESRPKDGLYSVKDIVAEMARSKEGDGIKSRKLTEKESRLLSEFIEIMQNWPSFLGPDLDPKNSSEILFSRDWPNRRQSLSFLSILNWRLRLVHLVLRGYSSDFVEIENHYGANENDLRDLEQDFHPLMIEKHMLHPSRVDVYKNRFIEANLFTFASFANPWVNVEEVTQLFSFMISAKRVGKRIHDDIGNRCLLLETPQIMFSPENLKEPKKDFFGGFEILKECYWKNFFSGLESTANPYLLGLPVMAEHYRTRSENEKENFRNTLIAVVRRSATSPEDVVDSSDTESVAGALQYIESVFSRFDRNGDKMIDFEEAKVMYPSFKYVIQKIAEKKGLKDEKDWEALFTYFLAHGEEPSTFAFLDWRYLTSWKNYIHADRSVVLKIFAKVSP